MARIEQKPQVFQPVVVTLETEAEYEGFLNLLDLATTSDRIAPASAEEALINALLEQLAAGIKVSP